MIKILVVEMERIVFIYAGCYEGNFLSKRMIDKCGFVPNPAGNDIEPHIFSGKDRLQLDFVKYR